MLPLPHQRRAKIVATIGPAISQSEQLERAIGAGMDVARLNFSHGTHAEHGQVIRDIRKISGKLNRPTAILQDLQGPKIRIGKLPGGAIELAAGDYVRIATSSRAASAGMLTTDFKALPQVVRPKSSLFLSDGMIELKVLKTTPDIVEAEVVFGGRLSERSGINIPAADLPVESLTRKDLRDLAFGLRLDVDFVALSFVRQAKDIVKLRKRLGKSQVRIVAKIETTQAIDHLEEIVAASDVVMVARGDLGVAVGEAKLPTFQKQIIHLCNRLSRPVIVATQMLESMTERPRPTRAEVTDVANAVLDGADALMLSAESAVGRHPIRAISTMGDIIVDAEANDLLYDRFSPDLETSDLPEAMATGAAFLAKKLRAVAIVALTTSGHTVQEIARCRPHAKLVAATDRPETLRALKLLWGIHPLVIPRYRLAKQAWNTIEPMLRQQRLAKPGDRVIYTFGMPAQDKVSTNTVHVMTVGTTSK